MKYRSLEVEALYERLRGAGEPVEFRGRKYADFDLRPFLDEILPKLPIPEGAAPRAFEYGTGTGPGACYLAERGFRVDAIDVSPTAIQLARGFAASTGLTVNFEVGDIAALRPWPRTYDLVVDNFCLHNLISDEQRRRGLAQVRALLRPEGYFAVGTSVFKPDRDYGDQIRDDRTGVVYSPLVDEAGDFDDVTRIAGGRYYARVRHKPPAEIREELEAAGLQVVHQRGGRIVCTRAASAAGETSR